MRADRMIPYKYLSLKKGIPAYRGAYWDFAQVEDMLSDPRFEEVEELTDGGIILFPARAQADKAKELNKYIKDLRWVVLMILGDEESDFAVEQIRHPNMKIYVMSPKKHHEGLGYLMTGYPPQAREHLKEYVVPTKDFFFSGQITHPRRQEFYQQIKHLKGGEVIATDGFTKGLKHEDYYGRIREAKVIPAPSGPVTADTFRLAEALEAGRIPIADNVDKNTTDYWEFFFGDYPFPSITNYSDLRGYIEDQLKDYTNKANRIYAWWILFKRNLKWQIIKDCRSLMENADE